MLLVPLPLILRRSAARFTMPMLATALLMAQAQQPPIGVPVPPLGAGPFVLDTAEQHKIRVTVVTKGVWSTPGAWRSCRMAACSSPNGLAGFASSATGCWTRSRSPAFRR